MLMAVKAPDQLDAVKVAALVGIVRHAKLGGITGVDLRKQVTDVMLELARQESWPGRSDDGHAWMRSLACEVLGLLESTGDKNEVSTALVGITADSDSPFFLRTAAATSLGRLEYPPGSFDSTKAAAALRRLIVDACTAEDEEFFRNRLKARLAAVSRGLAPLPPKPDAKPSPGELKDVVKAMLWLFDSRDLDEETLFARVKEMMPTLPEEPAPVEEPEPGPSDIPDDLPDDIPDDLPDDIPSGLPE